MTRKVRHGISKPGGGSPAPTVVAVRRGERGTRAQPQLQGQKLRPQLSGEARGSSSLSWQATTKLFCGTQPVQTSLQQTNVDIRLKQQHATPQLF